ncbi:SRPBCC domain-containing protein [Flavobacterium sp. SE-s28]|uniref:SRPBCC domain-containing protein n=2 Tax=Flavobacterium silvaticum TaxID=1852020 RepID=A0A972FT24_9FLAO|nr:SRPBCC domain-containing protein [Flavobacterium silvaticum]
MNSGQSDNYHVSFVTQKSPHDVFEAISSVDKWWTQHVKGKSKDEGDEFSVQFGDIHYSKHKLTTVIPDRKIVWLTTENRLNFVKNKEEWKGMEIVFEITTEASGTRVTFTQIGLDPKVECYDACSNAWNDYLLGSLQNLINTGKGNPTPKD